jgi:integrase
MATKPKKKTRKANGEGSIYERPDGRWMFSQRCGRDEEGKPLRRTIVARTRAEVVRRMQDERARNGGTLQPPVATTVAAYVASYLAGRDPANAAKRKKPKDDDRSEISESTFDCWSRAYKQAKPFLGMRLDQFDTKNVGPIRLALKKKYTPRVIQMIWNFLRLAFDEAIASGTYVRANPWRINKPPTYTPKYVRALQADEIPAFIAAARKDRLEALWLLCLKCGLRLGEALGLTWDSIDFEKGEIKIFQQVTEVAGISRVARLKTSGSLREVYMDEELMAALERRREAAIREEHGSPFAFTTATGAFLSRTNLRRRNFAGVCKRAEIADLTIHGLRHTWSVTSAPCVPVSEAALLGGWNSSRMLLDRYARHKDAERQREASLAIQARMTKS